MLDNNTKGALFGVFFLPNPPLLIWLLHTPTLQIYIAETFSFEGILLFLKESAEGDGDHRLILVRMSFAFMKLQSHMAKIQMPFHHENTHLEKKDLGHRNYPHSVNVIYIYIYIL